VDQTQREFLAEIDDLIEQLFDDLYKLREKQAAPPSRRALLEGVFRRVHSVKGSASSIGLDSLAGIAHESETLLDALRTGRVQLNDVVLDTLEDAINALSEALSAYQNGAVPPPPEALFECIHGLTDGVATEPKDIETIFSLLPSGIWQGLTEAEKTHLAEVLREGADLFVVATNFDVRDFDEKFYNLKEKLAELGEVISTSPTVDPQVSDKINFRILFANNSTSEDLKNLISCLTDVTADELKEYTSDKKRSDTEATLRKEVDSPPTTTNTVRLDLNELDGLISSTHELFRATLAALGFALSNCPDANTQEFLATRDVAIRGSFMAVEDQIINLRMVSVERILKHAVRAGRVAAQLAHKEIEFEVVGVDLKLDKLLCDLIADPLQHLIRNAVDHGIETREERLSRGKLPLGKVKIEAARYGTRTNIRVTDDGRGVEPAIVSRAATALGIIEEGDQLDMERSLRLIFRPGFSTAASVSNVSGRGVGLDVVETAAEQVGGEVRVSSEPGLGSSFEISMPMTFGLLRSTVLVSGGHRYCLDAGQVMASELANVELIEKDETGERIRIQGEPLPLLQLCQLLGEPAKIEPSGEVHIVTCHLPQRKGERSRPLALLVDDVEGSEELLIRNLGRHGVRWRGVAGAAELRDGTVALVIDLHGLLDAMQLKVPEFI